MLAIPTADLAIPLPVGIMAGSVLNVIAPTTGVSITPIIPTARLAIACLVITKAAAVSVRIVIAQAPGMAQREMKAATVVMMAVTMMAVTMMMTTMTMIRF